MALSVGDRLGPYEVIARLGEGGMGVVFRARETRLNRDAALKVLPDSFAADPDRLARFQREAQVLAALNHPNIAAIYGVEERALVMELVEGVDLTEAIRNGRFSGADGVSEARAVGGQIASALEAAHDAGVVHRDLKPANIKLRADGTVKVLDFGLAKAMGVDAGSGADVMNSPTMTTPAMTQAGMVMGTAAYMSPEQARGRPVDRRADIWAFGCVFYEMLTRTPIFSRDSVTDTLAAITRDQPDWQARPELPKDLVRLIKRCLDKDPRTRLRDIGEARIVLTGASPVDADVLPALAPPAARGSRLGTVAWLGIAAMLAVAASAVTWWMLSRTAAPGGAGLAAAITRVTSDAGLTTTPAVAPNGSLLAYASDRGGGSLNIWVQPLPDGQPVQVTHDEVDASDPSFSSDGSRIVYRSERNGGGIYVVPALGGTPRFIVAKGRNPRFSPDGKLIAYAYGGRGASSELWVVDEGGGASRRLATDLDGVGLPTWSPDGRFIVSVGVKGTGDNAVPDWWLLDPQGGASSRMFAMDMLKREGLQAAPAAWVPGTIALAATTGDVSSIWVVGVTADGRRLTGAARRLTAGVGADLMPTVVGNADDLTVYYANRDERANLYRLPLAGSRDVASLQRITDAAATDWWPSLSADARTLVFSSNRSGRLAVWLRDLSTGRETPLTAGGVGIIPTVSPDGQRVVYQVSPQGVQELVTRAVAGGAPEPVPKEMVWAWSWPVESLIFGGRRIGTFNELLVMDPSTRQVRPVITGVKEGFFGHGQLSPGGQWASAMQWSSADMARIILFPFQGKPATPDQLVALTDEKTVEEEHVWSAKDDAIYFVSERDGTRCIWQRRLDPATKRPVGPIESVLHLHGARRSMISTTDTPQRIALGGDALYFSIQEARGNIWKATTRVK